MSGLFIWRNYILKRIRLNYDAEFIDESEWNGSKVFTRTKEDSQGH